MSKTCTPCIAHVIKREPSLLLSLVQFNYKTYLDRSWSSKLHFTHLFISYYIVYDHWIVDVITNLIISNLNYNN
jgi:hypothetical protein